MSCVLILQILYAFSKRVIKRKLKKPKARKKLLFSFISLKLQVIEISFYSFSSFETMYYDNFL